MSLEKKGIHALYIIMWLIQMLTLCSVPWSLSWALLPAASVEARHPLVTSSLLLSTHAQHLPHPHTSQAKTTLYHRRHAHPQQQLQQQ